MDNSPSLLKYVEKHLTGCLRKSVVGFLSTAEPSSLGLDLDTVQEIGNIALLYMDLKTMDIGDLPGSAIVFDVVIEALIAVYDKDCASNDRLDIAQLKLTLRCRGDLACGLKDLDVYDVHVYDKRNQQSRRMSYALVPIIHKEDLEEVAKAFLAKYYKEVLEKPMPIDANELARRMGLTVISRQITPDLSVFGQIYFQTADSNIGDGSSDDDANKPIKPGTIVVDPDVYYQRNIGSYNNTIVHECVHWALHRKAFALRRLLNLNASQIQCRVADGIQGDSDEAMQIMEWQANALAPRIQMPLDMFRQQADATIERYRQELGAIELCDLMPLVISDLADFYRVSKMSAKLRMVEAGYEDAKCALIYIDGHYVKPFTYRHGAIRRDQTYCVSAADAILQFASNPLLKDVSHYVYIDSHLVLDCPKFVYWDNTGEAMMTDYARYHVDKCCLAFDMVICTRVEKDYQPECYLNRDKGAPVDIRVVFKGESGELSTEERNKWLSDQTKEIAKVKSHLPGDYSAAWKALLDWKGISQAELSRRTGIAEKTIVNIFSQKTNGTLKNLVMMCLGAHFPWDISEEILRRSGYELPSNKKPHMWYRSVLQCMYNEPLSDIRDYLKSVDPQINLEPNHRDDTDKAHC